MHNVEFKAELRDMPIALAVCRAIKATHIGTMDQTDTYFKVTSGRLKKRETAGEPVEYVYYERANRIHPKLSHFTLYDEAQALERFGSQPLPTWVVVRKHRDLWMHGAVRIHLDKVEGLGDFIEFEALVSKDNHVARCHESIAELRRAFGLALGEPIDCGYSDLLSRDSQIS